MTFIIEDGFNTSYIDSLLMGLFYKITHLQELLTKLPEKSKFAYLQDLINNMIDQTRRNFSVDASFINEIRNYSSICGWKDGMTITELYNVTEYLNFILKGFDFEGINCEVMELSNESHEEKLRHTKTCYVEIETLQDADIKTLLDEWISLNIMGKSKLLTYYRFNELPMLIPIYLNRLDKNNQSNNCSIDIKKRIKFHGNNDKTQSEMSWVIHSIICFSGSGNGKYYTVIKSDDDQWYLFSNDKIPSLIKINMSDYDLSNKIKQECVLIFYRLDDNLCKF